MDDFVWNDPLKLVKTKKVVNDAAEGVIKLMQDFAKSEVDKHDLLQSVERLIKKCQTLKKL